MHAVWLQKLIPMKHRDEDNALLSVKHRANLRFAAKQHSVGLSAALHLSAFIPSTDSKQLYCAVLLAKTAYSNEVV